MSVGIPAVLADVAVPKLSGPFPAATARVAAAAAGACTRMRQRLQPGERNRPLARAAAGMLGLA